MKNNSDMPLPTEEGEKAAVAIASSYVLVTAARNEAAYTGCWSSDRCRSNAWWNYSEPTAFYDAGMALPEAVKIPLPCSGIRARAKRWSFPGGLHLRRKNAAIRKKTRSVEWTNRNA
jgi:hypothetical protein